MSEEWKRVQAVFRVAVERYDGDVSAALRIMKRPRPVLNDKSYAERARESDAGRDQILNFFSGKVLDLPSKRSIG